MNTHTAVVWRGKVPSHLYPRGAGEAAYMIALFIIFTWLFTKQSMKNCMPLFCESLMGEKRQCKRGNPPPNNTHHYQYHLAYVRWFYFPLTGCDTQFPRWWFLGWIQHIYQQLLVLLGLLYIMIGVINKRNSGGLIGLVGTLSGAPERRSSKSPIGWLRTTYPIVWDESARFSCLEGTCACCGWTSIIWWCYKQRVKK